MAIVASFIARLKHNIVLLLISQQLQNLILTSLAGTQFISMLSSSSCCFQCLLNQFSVQYQYSLWIYVRFSFSLRNAVYKRWHGYRASRQSVSSRAGGQENLRKSFNWFKLMGAIKTLFFCSFHFQKTPILSLILQWALNYA